MGRLVLLCLALCSATQEAEVSQLPVEKYSFTFDGKMKGNPITFPGDIQDTQGIGQVCLDPEVQVPLPLFKRYTCHVLPDRNGRRRRKPSPKCAFAQVGIRGMEFMRAAIDGVEAKMNFELDELNLNKVGHNVMHQGFIYGDENGHYDYSSGYYCGQPADNVGYKWWGWVCQDPDKFVQTYQPMTNETMALDNWFPKQYHLVDRHFNCQLLWESEAIVGYNYDSCTHSNTSSSYRLGWRNCHSYVDDVVAMYDRLAELRGLPII